MANSLFLILEGRVQLLGETQQGEAHLVAVVNEGQILGEKAIIEKATSHMRVLSARAETATVCLELTLSAFEKLQREDPSLILFFLKVILANLSDRFDRANYLIRLLRSSDNYHRLLDCILFSSQRVPKSPSAREVILDLESIHSYIDMDRAEIDRCIKVLIQNNLLLPKEKSHYLIPNTEAFLNAAPLLQAATPKLKVAG